MSDQLLQRLNLRFVASPKSLDELSALTANLQSVSVQRQGARYNSFDVSLPTDWLVFVGTLTVSVANIFMTYFKSKPNKVFRYRISDNGTPEILDKNLSSDELREKLAIVREIEECPISDSPDAPEKRIKGFAEGQPGGEDPN